MSENLISIIVLGILCLVLFVFIGLLMNIEEKRYKEGMELKKDFLKEVKRYNDVQQSVKEGIFKVNGNFNKHND